jgi:hypothetical protein
MKRIAVAVLSMIASCAVTLAGSAPFSELQAGDRLHVSYHSRGCFHDRKYEIDFERAESVRPAAPVIR